MAGLIFTYIIALVLLGPGIIVLKWCFNNKLYQNRIKIVSLWGRTILLSNKGRISIIAVGLILLISGGLMLKSALGL